MPFIHLYFLEHTVIRNKVVECFGASENIDESIRLLQRYKNEGWAADALDSMKLMDSFVMQVLGCP